jgi:spore coat protein U-like protein
VISSLKVLTALLFLLLAGGAEAACSVSATGVNFGAYDVFVATPYDSTGTVTVTCDQAPPVDVTITIGPSGTSGGFIPRQMRSSSSPDRLNYNLFVNAGRSTVWGDGAAGTSTVFLKNVKKNRPTVTTIYGRIPPGQDVSVGSYFDSLTVTITP